METHVSLSDLKKAFDQTLRTLKREVNKRVLKAPDIEQKVLEATCNEPWGPHGSIMADIAKASRDYHEYQIIMPVIWKRLRDTGQNWRHVYKALILLEYLVINGSEKVVNELIEHMLELQALTDFQYTEPPPYEKDQGINVQKKAQTVVALLKDSEGLRELRKKSMNNKKKYEGISSAQFSTKSERNEDSKEKEIEIRGSSPPGYDDIFSSQYDETTGQNVTRDGSDFTDLARNYSQGPSVMQNSSINKNNTDGKLNPREIQSTSAGKDWFSAAFEQPLRQDNLITSGKPLSGPQIHSTEMWNAHSRGIEIRRISFDNPSDQHQMAASFLPSPIASSKIIPYTQPWPQDNILRSRQEPETKTLMPSLITRENLSSSLTALQMTERNLNVAFENGRTISREDRIMRSDRKANEKPKPLVSQMPENLQDTWGDWCGS